MMKCLWEYEEMSFRAKSAARNSAEKKGKIAVAQDQIFLEYV